MVYGLANSLVLLWVLKIFNILYLTIYQKLKLLYIFKVILSGNRRKLPGVTLFKYLNKHGTLPLSLVLLINVAFIIVVVLCDLNHSFMLFRNVRFIKLFSVIHCCFNTICSNWLFCIQYFTNFWLLFNQYIINYPPNFCHSTPLTDSFLNQKTFAYGIFKKNPPEFDIIIWEIIANESGRLQN